MRRFGITALSAGFVARFSRWLNAPCQLTEPDGTPRGNTWLGEYGERVAADWLRARRCRILARNYKGPRRGEVDIIARQRKLLLFVEVKTRRADTPVRPFDAVTKDKQALVERGANAWLRELRTRELPWRFDVIEVYLEDGRPPRVNHIRNAF